MSDFETRRCPCSFIFLWCRWFQTASTHEQYKALVEYCDRLSQNNLYFRYESLADLREQLHRHLGMVMIDLLSSVQPNLQTLSESRSESASERQRRALDELRKDFVVFLRRVLVEWEAERDSEPFGIDEGKSILSRAADQLLDFRSKIVSDNSGFSATLDGAPKDIRKIQRHEVFIDGGVSFGEFWAEGDRILSTLSTVPDILAKLIEKKRGPAVPQ